MRHHPGDAALPVLRRSPRPRLVEAYRSPAYRSGSRQAPTRHRWPLGCPLPDNGAGNLPRQGRRNCSMTAQAFGDQVSLLVRALPEIAREDIFALQGGTAINLFVRDLPRLSVDIDLVYLPVADHARSLQAVSACPGTVASTPARVG